MIASMTAFARSQADGDFGVLVWELRSVNHRYLDISLRIPDSFRDLEQVFRELMQQKIGRGKLEANLKFQPGPAATPTIKINQAFLKQFSTVHPVVNQQFDNKVSVDFLSLLQWPGMLQEEKADMANVRKICGEVLEKSIKELQSVREREGDSIHHFLKERLEAMKVQVTIVQKHLPDILATQRQKLLDKMQEISERFDQERLEQEMVFVAQRLDVTEEIDRLKTHIDEVARVLKEGGPVGRRLDFLMQELNREANTLSSKSISTLQTHAAVEMKVLIEQMREQVQNVE